MQDDLLHETLTVWEVLYYAAMLRLPHTMTKEQKMQRVSTVIQALGIEKCKDTIIGEQMLLTVHLHLHCIHDKQDHKHGSQGVHASCMGR